MEQETEQPWPPEPLDGNDAFDEGVHYGRALASRHLLVQVVSVRFQELPMDILLRLTLVQGPRTLESLHKEALVAENIDVFRRRLHEATPHLPTDEEILKLAGG
jgi:hypothetical protein